LQKINVVNIESDNDINLQDPSVLENIINPNIDDGMLTIKASQLQMETSLQGQMMESVQSNHAFELSRLKKDAREKELFASASEFHTCTNTIPG
jgi:regulatory protein YycI of two-component signal transduction system YycFG